MAMMLMLPVCVSVCLSDTETFGPILLVLGCVEVIVMLFVCLLISRSNSAHSRGKQVCFLCWSLRVNNTCSSVALAVEIYVVSVQLRTCGRAYVRVCESIYIYREREREV